MARNVSVINIYFYLVCIIAIIIFIIGVIGLADGIANYLKPNNYMTKENIIPSYKSLYPALSEEELNKLIEKEITNSLANEQNLALKSIIRNAIMIIISIPLFVFHWKKAQELWRLSLAN